MSSHSAMRRSSSNMLRTTLRSTAASTPSLFPGLRAASISKPLASVTCQKRAFAAKRRAPPAPKLVRTPVSPSAGPPIAEMYDVASIPFPKFEEMMLRYGGSFKSLSAAQYYEALSKFCEAVKSGTPAHAVRLPGDDGVPPATMHEIGCILLYMSQYPSARYCYGSLWASASEQGYRPSTLTLARMHIRSGRWGQNSGSKTIETRFKNIVAEGNDANALTADGELLYQQGKYEAAIKTLRQALRLYSPKFQWMAICYVCFGRSLLKLGRREEAIEALEKAVELRSSDADGELGELLRTSDPERAEQLIYNAALGGVPSMYSHLSEYEMERQGAATDDESRKEHERWAMEWSRLGDPRAPF